MVKIKKSHLKKPQIPATKVILTFTMMQQKNMKNQESDEREKNIFSHLEIEFFQSQNDQMTKNS